MRWPRRGVADGSARRSQSIRRRAPSRSPRGGRGDERFPGGTRCNRRVPDKRVRLRRSDLRSSASTIGSAMANIAGAIDVLAHSRDVHVEDGAPPERRARRRHRSTRPVGAGRAIRAATHGSIARAPGSPRPAAPTGARGRPRGDDHHLAAIELVLCGIVLLPPREASECRAPRRPRFARAESRPGRFSKAAGRIASQLPYSTMASRCVCHARPARAEPAGQRVEHGGPPDRRAASCLRPAELNDEQRGFIAQAAASGEAAATASWPLSIRT